MTDSLEFEGKKVEIAVKNACDALNIAEEELNYEVITRGSTGIFGLVGVKSAKIRVVMNHKEPEEKEYKSTDADDERKSIEKGERKETQPAYKAESKPRDGEGETPAQIGKEVLTNITKYISADSNLEIEEGYYQVRFNIRGEDAGILIGKRGQTLEAIQYITEKIINKRSERRIRVEVDVEGYMETKRENLIRLAERLAEKAKSTGRPSILGQMNAHDRRIVHLALKDDNNVRTQSMGDGYLRKLVIYPKKDNYRRRSYR